MKSITFTLYGVVCAIMTTANVAASELTWGFKSPAFHYGNGYSSHVLSVEQLQFNRKKEREDEAKSEAARIERELENTTLNKFIKNVESRIYATLSKQMVDSMFADCDPTTSTCANSGTAEIEGSTITWAKDTTTGEITLTVVEEDGSTTTITIPGAGEFNF
jgi:hypothetical protein|tara:strand:+ start:1001 stop:1486 length:486 start_codon:yes stop_codon:yes gene_type:complete